MHLNCLASAATAADVAATAVDVVADDDDVDDAVDVPEIVSCCVPALHASALLIDMIDKFRLCN